MVPVPTSEYIEQARSAAEQAFPNTPPYHRKARVRKKWAKKFARERQWRVATITTFMVPLRRGAGSFQCPSCGSRMGGYQALARALIQVEPMPQGALPCYDRDPTKTWTISGQASVEAMLSWASSEERVKK